MFGFLTGLFGIPQVIVSAINFATATVGPLLSKGLELAGWFLSTIWEGLKDIFDNAATIFTVACIAVGCWAYGKVPAEVKVQKCEREIQVQKVYIQKQCPKATKAPRVEEFKFPWDN